MQLALATFIAVLGTVNVSSAWACSCDSIAPESILSYGDIIAEGTVAATATEPTTSCVSAAKEMQRVCGSDSNTDCRQQFEGQLTGCGEPTIIRDVTAADVRLSDVWKGPQLSLLTLQYTETGSGACGMSLRPGEQFGFIAYRTEMGGWKTSECLTFPFGTLSAGDGPFGSIVQPILQRHRDKLQQAIKEPDADFQISR